jgi:hypothetical protein
MAGGDGTLEGGGCDPYRGINVLLCQSSLHPHHGLVEPRPYTIGNRAMTFDKAVCILMKVTIKMVVFTKEEKKVMNRKQMITIGLLSLSAVVVSAAVIGAAILDQMRQPAEQRTWQGQLGGIPYDFRSPTLERIREKFWNKDTSRVVTPRLFGVGWSLNFYPLFHRAAQ